MTSSQVAVTVPVQRGLAALKTINEGVHAIEVDEDMIPTRSN